MLYCRGGGDMSSNDNNNLETHQEIIIRDMKDDT